MPRKKDTSFSRLRKDHKAPLDWVVIDIPAFNREATRHAPVDHQGKFLASVLRAEKRGLERGVKPRV
ncbi:hypothetical protein L0Y59_03975, partial [Candidatus Uhrbacteria bacterium]|nr:hypothetical protein [Candidatus Uhrbacteria bacterium]